jgi:hypothetical protein
MEKVYYWKQLKDECGNYIMEYGVYCPGNKLIARYNEKSLAVARTKQENKEDTIHEQHVREN